LGYQQPRYQASFRSRIFIALILDDRTQDS
jgi:hypothetical protein